MYGGVGILANQKTVPGLLAAGSKDGAAATLAESGRYLRAAIHLQREGKQFLHITNMYLEPQFDTPAQARKERMMKLALEDIAKLGDQAALICVDQNCSSMAIMEAAIEAGDWVDHGKRFAIGDPEPTFGRDKAWDRVAAEHCTSRPDRVYANAIAAQAITKYRLIRHTGVPQHLPIEITFRAAALKKRYIAIQPPAAFPVDEHQEVGGRAGKCRSTDRVSTNKVWRPRVCKEMRKQRGKSSTKLRRTTWNGCAKMWWQTKVQLENEDEGDFRSWWNDKWPPQREVLRTCSQRQQRYDASRRL